MLETSSSNGDIDTNKEDINISTVSHLLNRAKSILILSKSIYKADEDGLYYEEVTKDGKIHVHISNFIPITINNVIDKTTVADNNRIEVIGIKGMEVLKPIILNEIEFSNERWILKNWGYGCILYDKYEFIKGIIQAMASVSTEHKMIYNYLGWDTDLTCRRYLLYNGVITSENPQKSSKKISFTKNLDGYMLKRNDNSDDMECDDYIFKTLLQSAKHEITYTALSFAFLSLVKSQFENWSFKPDFVYMLLGKTGSMKTTFAKLFFNMYSKFWETVPINFQATLAALERFYVEFRDTTLLIDDIAPVTDKTEKRKRDDKFEKIIRAAGDNTARQKMIKGIENELKISCLICFTGEDIPVNSPSTLARLFTVNLTAKCVNLENLTFAQENKELYTTFITKYIEYICTKENYVNDFKKTFLGYRKNFERNHTQQIHGRFINNNSWLMSSFEMFLTYEFEKGYIDKSIFNKMKEEFFQILISASKEQQQSVQCNDISSLFVDAFNQMLFSQNIIICEIITANGKKNCTINPCSHNSSGYYDGQYYFFLPDILYQKICWFYGSGSSIFPWSKNEFYKSLKNEGILVTDQSGANTVWKAINGKRMRLVRLDAARIENFYNVTED